MSNKVHVKLRNVKVELGTTSVEVTGQHHFYNDAGKEISSPQSAKLMRLNFKEDPDTGTVCFSLTKEALADIVSKLSMLPDVYSFDNN